MLFSIVDSCFSTRKNGNQTIYVLTEWELDGLGTVKSHSAHICNLRKRLANTFDCLVTVHIKKELVAVITS